MKKTFFTFIALLAFIQTFATIRRVNNNPGVVTNSAGPFVYNNFNSAISAASPTAADTIYLEPSDINYGDLNIAKKIVLIGPGYLLDKNPNTPFDKRSVKVNSISFLGTINSQLNPTVPTGSVIYGITVQNDNGVYGNISIGGSNSNFGVTSEISIFNCLFNSLSRASFGGSGHNLKRCFILGDVQSLSSNSVISNCIILGNITGSSNNTIKNNIIFNGITPNSAVIYNNIIVPVTSPTVSFPNESNVFNNVCMGCTGAPTFNNFFTTSSNTIFQVAEPRILDDLWDERFKLATSSPAKTKGVNGIDCGVFAGNEPYILSGLPPFPMVTAFSQGAPSGGNIPITISIKRN